MHTLSWETLVLQEWNCYNETKEESIIDDGIDFKIHE